MSISETVNNALKIYLSDDWKLEQSNAVLRRLDQMTRQIKMLKQKANVMSEAFAHYLTITPQIPAAQCEAANALGEDRFERYKGHLKTILSHTSRHLFGIMDDVYMDEDSFFTEAELEALSRVATEETIRKEQQSDSEEGV